MGCNFKDGDSPNSPLYEHYKFPEEAHKASVFYEM